MKLTNKNVEQLSIEKNGYIVWDSEVKGFGVRVNLNSKKTFILKFRVGQGRAALIGQEKKKRQLGDITKQMLSKLKP